MIKVNNDFFTKLSTNFDEEYSAKLPGNDNENITVYAKCVDLNNLVGIYTAQVNVKWSGLTTSTYS